MFSSKKARVVLFTVVLLLISISMYLFNRAPEIKYLNDGAGNGSVKYEKAKVLRVVNEDLQQDPQDPELRTSTQDL